MRARSPLLVLVAAALLGGCVAIDVSESRSTALTVAPRSGAAARPARINHVVFFKLRDPGQAAALIADCDRLLPTIPGVAAYYCGRHHEVGRATIDSDYDVGAFVGFDSDADYAAYVEHARHVELVTTWRPRLEWLRVYDVLDETP